MRIDGGPATSEASVVNCAVGCADVVTALNVSTSAGRVKSASEYTAICVSALASAASVHVIGVSGATSASTTSNRATASWPATLRVPGGARPGRLRVADAGPLATDETKLAIVAPAATIDADAAFVVTITRTRARLSIGCSRCATPDRKSTRANS